MSSIQILTLMFLLKDTTTLKNWELNFSLENIDQNEENRGQNSCVFMGLISRRDEAGMEMMLL